MQVGRRGGTGQACTLRGGEFHSSLAVYGGIIVLYTPHYGYPINQPYE